MLLSAFVCLLGPWALSLKGATCYITIWHDKTAHLVFNFNCFGVTGWTMIPLPWNAASCLDQSRLVFQTPPEASLRLRDTAPTDGTICRATSLFTYIETGGRASAKSVPCFHIEARNQDKNPLIAKELMSRCNIENHCMSSRFCY